MEFVVSAADDDDHGLCKVRRHFCTSLMLPLFLMILVILAMMMYRFQVVTVTFFLATITSFSGNTWVFLPFLLLPFFLALQLLLPVVLLWVLAINPKP